MVETQWYHLIAYFFGGAFLMNKLPHLVSGVTGNPFPTPFASPPGKGLSPPLANVLWAAFNLLVAYLLLCHVGEFEPRRTTHVAALGLGMFLIAALSALVFRRPRSGGP